MAKAVIVVRSSKHQSEPNKSNLSKALSSSGLEVKYENGRSAKYESGIVRSTCRDRRKANI